MPREQAVKARRERNQALVEAMVLAAIADGSVSEREMKTLLGRILERPEFEGTRPDEVAALVDQAVTSLTQASGLEQVLESLRARLPDHKNRMLAFGLAAAVAFADRRASRAELGLLKKFQKALGISEDEVAQLIEVVEKGDSLAEALGEPLERLYAEVMVLVSAADGRLKEAEARAMVESLASDPAFTGVNAQSAQDYVSEAAKALATEGLPQRLTVLAHGLSTHSQRLKAYRLAARVAKAGGPSRPEVKMLELLQATFGLADDEAQRIREEA
ncbi:MAG: tellurite resistance TerB family protein [Myxococcales bacterium]|nr:tellurite resistance TerB family protein [Myxococcales bacterium]